MSHQLSDERRRGLSGAFLAALALGGARVAQAVPPAGPSVAPSITVSSAQKAKLYPDPFVPLEIRVNDLFSRMTQAEKLSLLALNSNFNPISLQTAPIDRLHIPALRFADGPQGVRDGPATCFPFGVTMASTWDPPLIRQVGAALGEEAKSKNRQVLFGPCVNIHRTPQDGRNYESFSEDPYLASQMAVAYINGVQSQGVAACVKHFACNNQEADRHNVDVQVDERALREIYLPAFRASAERGRAWALMDSFNRINGTYVAHNHFMLTDILKTEWNWDGMVVSDWGAIHNTVEPINAGNDIELPRPEFMTPAAVQTALDKGQISQAAVDGMIRRILRCLIRTGLMDSPKPPVTDTVNSPEHQRLALQVAEEGIVLLKNTGGLLPLNRHTLRSIAILGPSAANTPLGGRWSADVQPLHSVSVLDAIKQKLGAKVTVNYAEGCPRTGNSDPAALAAAAALAAKSEVAVVVVGMDNNYEGEELDPPNLSLPGDQEKLIQAVAAANAKTIVILVNGTTVLMGNWLNRIPCLLEPWYAGQDAGTAIAEILFGDISPSGKLTDTIAARREDYSDWGNYPGANHVVKYVEGIYVGYRHFDKHHITPLFPFGYGLSYTTFQYGGLKVPHALKRGHALTVTVNVRNTGAHPGHEVVQLYVRDLAPKVDRPMQELKGFQRVSLAPGETKAVSLSLDESAFAYYDVEAKRWKANPGSYEIAIGSSSRDIRARAVVRLE